MIARRGLFGLLAAPLVAFVGAAEASVEAPTKPAEAPLALPRALPFVCRHEPEEQAEGQPWHMQEIRRLDGSLLAVHLCRHCGVFYANEAEQYYLPASNVIVEHKQRTVHY